MRRLLTDAVLRQMLPVDGRAEISDGAVRGLRVRGRRSSGQWLLRRTFGAGKRVRVTIGEWPYVGVEAARAIAGEVILRAARGEDVEQITRRTKPSITVADLIDRWEKSRSASLRTAEKTAREMRNGLTNKMLAMSAMELTRESVLGHFDKMAEKNPAKVHRLCSHVRVCWAWAEPRGYVALGGMDGLHAGAKWKDRLRTPSVMEIRLILKAASQDTALMHDYVRLLALTGLRRNELARARWDWIDWSNAVMHVPAEIMKGGVAERVALSRQVVEILRSRERNSEVFVFTSEQSGHSKPIQSFSEVKARIVARLSAVVRPLEHWTWHDFRRAFMSGVIEAGADPMVADRCLNHRASATVSKVMAVYMRSDLLERRRDVMQLWADLILPEISTRPVSHGEFQSATLL